jgi:hypothetical protein
VTRRGLVEDEGVRSARLLDAQAKAAELFAAIEPRGIIAAGVRETEASDAVRDLAAEMFGVDRHWHKRIVRAGPNTLQPYRKNPPDRAIAADDIVFLDFGPIFEQWEADFGRTYVLGDDPVKLRLRNALPVMFRAGRQFFEAHEDVTGEQLYAHMTGLAEADGWTFGGTIAGHLVGQFPHEKIAGEDIESYIAPGSDKPMRRTDRNGQVCHWILEVHLVDLDRQIGGFFEELLDLGPGPGPVLGPVHGGGAEIEEAVLGPQAAVPGEAVAVAGPAGRFRAAPGPVGDAGQAGQQEEGQVVEAGDGFGPDRGLDAGDLRGPAGPERIGGLPPERVGDGLGCVDPQAETAMPVCLARVGQHSIGRRLGVGDIEVAVGQR